MRDDIDKLGLPRSAKKYARRKASDGAMERQPDEYIRVQAEVTNQPRKGFQNRDTSQNAEHTFKEEAQRVVADMLENGKEASKAMVRSIKAPTKLSVKWVAAPSQEGSWDTVDLPWYVVRNYRKMGFNERGSFLLSWLRKEHGKDVDQYGDLDVMWAQGQNPMKVTTTLKKIEPRED